MVLDDSPNNNEGNDNTFEIVPLDKTIDPVRDFLAENESLDTKKIRIVAVFNNKNNEKCTQVADVPMSDTVIFSEK